MSVLLPIGTKKGLFLLRGDASVLAAEARVDGGSVAMAAPADAAGSAGAEPPPQALPLSILNYVRRTRERVSLADAAAPNPFSQDPYLAGRGQEAKKALKLPSMLI